MSILERVNKRQRRVQGTYSLMAISMRSWLTPPEGAVGVRPNMDIWTQLEVASERCEKIHMLT